MSIRVLRPGLLTSIQDSGRSGYAHLGVSSGGAMDKTSLTIANQLVGNPVDQACLEITLFGPLLRFEKTGVIALAGAQTEARLNGQSIDLYQALEVPAGSELDIRSVTQGARVYLSLAGGLRLEKVLQSYSTHILAGFGGFKGRALKPEDVIELNSGADEGLDKRRCRLPPLYYGKHPQIRVVKGPEHESFSAADWQQFLSTTYQVTTNINRMGIRLDGPVLGSHQDSMLSRGLYQGDIQIPPNGQPIIAGAECQTIGGYPRIAHVISCDLDLIGQLAPGYRLSFVEVSFAEAARLFEQKAKRLQQYFSRADFLSVG